jgi:ABC-type transporter Mla maintaining outer membrane lipid asymmetry permease subunit MlaE
MKAGKDISDLLYELRNLRPPFERLNSMHGSMVRAAGQVTYAETFWYGMILLAEALRGFETLADYEKEDFVLAVAAILEGREHAPAAAPEGPALRVVGDTA